MTAAPEKYQNQPLIQKKLVICPHDCPDACCMSVSVQNGRVIKIEGEKTHPFTRGFLCIKTNYYLERLYSPLRILYPQKRVGPKGSGQFQRISWEEAINLIAGKFKEVENAFGAEAILPYSYAGNMGLLANASMDRRFFNDLGASLLERTICSKAGGEGFSYTMGARIGTDPESLPDSKLIILWGTNPVSTNVHLMPFVNEARKRGAKLIVIDPHRSKTADQADQFIQPFPGTDAALALGMIRIIINEKLYGQEFVAAHTTGFEALKEHVQQYTPEKAAEITGIAAEQITRLAREYAATKPSCIRMGYGLNRHTNGGMMTRTIACLPGLIGAWGVPGGGALLSTGGAFKFNNANLERPDFLNRHQRKPRTINMIKLGEALLEYDAPPVKALFVYNCNPAAVTPNQAKVIRGLEREDLFTVVHEQVMTDTALYADILLPATTVFEADDLYSSYGHLYVQLSEAAIPPSGESKPNIEVFSLLARQMGFDDPCFNNTAEELIRQALESNDQNMQNITYERLKEETFVRLNVPRPFIPFKEGKYPTPSGKIEFYSEKMLKAGLSPLPTHQPTAESSAGSPELFSRYPLQLITPAAHHFLNSSFADMPTMLRKQRYPALEINQVDAEKRGISDGEWIRVWNDRGEAYFIAEVQETVAEGVVCHVSLWWRQYSPKGWNCNVLTSDAEADMGRGATFHTNLVQAEKASHKLNPQEVNSLKLMFPLL